MDQVYDVTMVSSDVKTDGHVCLRNLDHEVGIVVD